MFLNGSVIHINYMTLYIVLFLTLFVNQFKFKARPDDTVALKKGTLMKGIYLGSVAVLFLCMVLFPLLSMRKTVLPGSPGTEQASPGKVSSETFSVKLTEEDKIVKLSAYDYICGVVGAEVPAEYEEEALKAQAVAAYTFALYRKQVNKNEKYDITDSTASDQAFISDSDAKERWGSNYESYKEKIGAAVKAVLGQKLTYDGKLILSVYHNISGGKTESAANIWGGDYPYLMAVESVGDVLCPDYLSSAAVSSDDFKTKVSALGVTFSGEADTWLGEKKTSESGTVLSLAVCGTEVSGNDLRQALGLKSANFDVSFADGSFTFSVRGHGHGVGMSQYGAQFMALQGSSYEEILKWYYKGCEIE